MKLFFRDKGTFFSALITPVILLVLYISFLGNVYRDSFLTNLPGGITLPEKLINSLVGGQLISSILAVSCVTIAFCSNFLMVQDKANGSIRDLTIAPVKGSALAIGYYIASLLSTLIICLIAMITCLGYLAVIGWYLSFTDVLCLLADVILLTLFGTALSSVINHFLSTQGQISAVGSIISSGYGFICGAYMPISSFGEGLQKVISFLPGTYGTALVRTHSMQGAINEMKNHGLPQEAIREFKDALDCNLYFFSHPVSIPMMYLILGGVVALLLAVYILICKKKKRA
jgi:multidrug/hemolysin transport system permease protein